MKILKSSILYMLFLSVIISLNSCQDDNLDLVNDPDIDKSEAQSQAEVLSEFTGADLQNMLKEMGLNDEVSSNLSPESKSIAIPNPAMALFEAIKVSGTTSHPNGNGGVVKNSGVLFLPKFCHHDNLRIVVVSRGSAIDKNMAPSVVWKDLSTLPFRLNSLLSYDLIFVTLVEHGYAVLIPDNVGYGDSYGQCYPATLVAKPTATSVANLVKDAQKVIEQRNLTYKKDILIAGYSLGGYVSVQLAKELETNPSYGLSVKLLTVGGANTDLKYLADKARLDGMTAHPIVPAMFASLNQNGYSYLNLSQIFDRKWAGGIVDKFSGKYGDMSVQAWVSPLLLKNSIYTTNFKLRLDSDRNLAYINTILQENSLKPWKNKCKFYMMHGLLDNVTFEAPAKNFTNSMKAVGGDVKYKRVLLGDHATAAVSFYVEALAEARLNR